jgi:hypothetical protein
MNIQHVAEHDCEEDWLEIRDVLRGTNASLLHPLEVLFGTPEPVQKMTLLLSAKLANLLTVVWQQQLASRTASTVGRDSSTCTVYVLSWTPS